MPGNSELRVNPTERGQHMTSTLGECDGQLPGCGICCKQRNIGAATTAELVGQKWEFGQETDETSRGKKSTVIGEGAFSIVYLKKFCLPSAKPVLCAVKRVELAARSTTNYRKWREVRVLKTLQEGDDWHRSRQKECLSAGYRYIVPYLGAYVKAQSIHIVMEYMAQSDLKHYMGIPWREHNTKIAIKQLLSGIQFLHGFGWAHRDLKPLNIFPILSHDHTLLLKIGDFGAAKLASDLDPLITTIGTWEFMAPEILDLNPYTLSVDIWSLGYLSFTLLTGKSLFPDRKAYYAYVFHPDGYEEYAPRKALLAEGIEDEDAIDLVTKMLQVNPNDRLSAEGALSHRWFNNPSGVEPEKVTTDLYDHFKKVLGGKMLQRFIDVQPVEGLFETNACPSMDLSRPVSQPKQQNVDTWLRFFRRRFRVKHRTH